MGYKDPESKGIVLTIAVTLLAVILFVPLFVTRGLGPLDFWWWLSANLIILIFIAAFFDPAWRASILQDLSGNLRFKIGMGILFALLLYVFFAIGNFLSKSIFSFAESGIQDVYAFKMGASRFRIAVLMIFFIGPRGGKSSSGGVFFSATFKTRQANIWVLFWQPASIPSFIWEAAMLCSYWRPVCVVCSGDISISGTVPSH